MSVIHYVIYEPPLAAFMGCGRRIRYDEHGGVVFSQRGTISTDPSDVTCAVCLRHIAIYKGRAPRVLGPTPYW